MPIETSVETIKVPVLDPRFRAAIKHLVWEQQNGADFADDLREQRQDGAKEFGMTFVRAQEAAAAAAFGGTFLAAHEVSPVQQAQHVRTVLAVLRFLKHSGQLNT